MTSVRKRPTWIPVVAAVIRREGKVLLGKRPEETTLAGCWEFPGGKIELGEAPEVALARELREELGIEAQIGELKLVSTHDYAGVGILILFYEVQFWKGELKSIHHDGLKWVLLSELSREKLPDANSKVLPQLLSRLNA